MIAKEISEELDSPLYSSQKDEERPQIGTRIIPEPDDLNITYKRPVTVNDVKEVDSTVIDLDGNAAKVNETLTQIVADTLPEQKKVTILDKIVLTIYQLLY